jgi:hypothetical protein
MNSDDFEKQLQRQPLRQVPGEWREKILQNATPARRLGPPKHSEGGWLSLLTSNLSRLLWPHPKAWAGLAALWVAMIVVQFASSDPASHAGNRAETLSPDAMVMLKQQQKLLGELVQQSSPIEPSRTKPNVQQPRSDRRKTIPFA